MANLLNLHVQYWEKCEICGFTRNLDQDEAENYKSRECTSCSTYPQSSWSYTNDKGRSTRCTTKEFL